MVKATRLAQKQTGLSCCCEGSYALMRVCCDNDSDEAQHRNRRRAIATVALQYQ